jgi:hypothetical protein
MKIRVIAVSIVVLLLVSSCQTAPVVFTANYVYELGLGYGFLGKQVQVSVDGVPVLFLVGNEEMETFAQLQGTKMLYKGSTNREEITISVSVDGGFPVDKIIDLGKGRYIHIYQDPEGLWIYNTSELVFE